MKNNLIKVTAIITGMVMVFHYSKAQNVTYASNTVSISIADVIGIVDDNNNQIEAFSEATAFNMGAVSFTYPDAAAYQQTQTTTGGHFNVSASTPFLVQVRAASASFSSAEATATIPVGVLSITGTADEGVLITDIPPGALSTAYQTFATGGTGAVLSIAPTYSITAAQAQTNIFGIPDGTYSTTVFYQVSAQ